MHTAGVALFMGYGRWPSGDLGPGQLVQPRHQLKRFEFELFPIHFGEVARLVVQQGEDADHGAVWPLERHTGIKAYPVLKEEPVIGEFLAFDHIRQDEGRFARNLLSTLSMMAVGALLALAISPRALARGPSE